jgi:hypothetical protein
LIGIFLLAAALSVEATQARLDELVVRCKAERVVAFKAHSKGEVIIDMKNAGEAPSPMDQQAFDCVLSGMKKMNDLKFGFLGNEAVSEAKNN